MSQQDTTTEHNFVYTTSFSDSDALQLSQVGGKGRGLAQLTQNGITVPSGFVLTVDAYRAFVADNALDSIIASTTHDETDFDTASTSLRAAFGKSQLSNTVQREIQQRLVELHANTVAVRSSATAEDLPDSSFAGQQDTYLNVSATNMEVNTAVVDCFASLFTARAMHYRQAHDITNADMAVVIQSMVSTKCSGVLFTAHPLTGRRTESVLEVTPGLGEALVSGMVDPDRYVIYHTKDDKWTITDAKVGTKQTSVQPLAEGGGGVTRVDNKASSDTFVLTDEQVLELARYCQNICKNVFDNTPQDIEWALSTDGSFQILQSRPVTTLFPLPDGMTTDAPLQVMFSFGAFQGLAGPITPLGQDSIRIIMGGASTLLYGTRGVKERRERMACIAAERIYLNATPVVCNSAGRKFISYVLTMVEPGIAAGLKQVVEDPQLSVTGGLSVRFLARILPLYSVILPRYLYTWLFADRARKGLFSMMEQRLEEIQQQCDQASNLQQVLQVYETAMQNFFPSVILHFVPRMGVIMSSLLGLNRLAASIPDGKDVILTLLRGLPYNVTTEMDLALWLVARKIRDDPESRDWFHQYEADKLANDYLAKSLPTVAQNTLEPFMHMYGMRGLAEIDFGQPRWRENPSPLMHTLKSYMDIGPELAPDRLFERGAQVAEDAAQRLAQETRWPRLVAFLVSRIRALAGIRELPKFTAIRCMGIFRARMLLEAESLVKSGILDSPTDMFMLHLDELKDLASGEERDWKSLVASRRALMQSESKRKRIPQVLTSDGFAYYGGAVPTLQSADDSGNALCGEPVSPGTAQGKVRVVLDPSKTRLLPGEVLVCPGTDPSWTPLFFSACALVMEVGGMMTHGSVVAREVGIPAVVGVEHVTEKLTTGQMVRVNGSTGFVEVLDEKGEPMKHPM